MRLKSTSPMINGTTKKNRGDENMGIIRQHHYETDLNKPLTRHNVGVLLAEGDSGGDTFSVSVMLNGVAENLKDDVSVVAQFIRSDGNTVVMEGVNLLHSAQVTLLDACYVCEGRFTLTIKVTSYGTTTTVAIIDGMIRRTTTDTLVDPEEKIVNITSMQEMLEEAEAAAERAEAAANRAESGGGGGGGGGGIVTETDPTVPAWAKAASKPTYSKSEVGLGNVDNVKQYSASNPPPYPVRSVAGKTGAVTLGKLTIKGAASGSYDGSGNVTITIPTVAGEPGKDGADYSFDPTVYGLPVLYLTGDTAPIAVSKDNKVTMSYVYGDRSGACTLKGQGATSYKTAKALVDAGKAGKFNYTIKFDNAFEAKEGWGAQEKYCLKANFIDTTHSRNIVSCILWGMSVKARSTVPAELANLPNGGAIDGFPIVIMLNDKFHGLYTWNIPKDGWMFGMVEDATKTQAIVGADDHTAATQFKEASMTGFEVEFVSDEDNAAWVETSLTRLISAVMNSDGSDLDTTVAQYLDWNSAIDHYIHTVVDKAADCVDKNYLLATFNGVKWYMSAYDRDSIHGLNWDASGTSRPVSNISFDECAATVRIYELIKRFKTNALKARYKELRSNVLSESRIMQRFENFAWAIPSPVMLEDVKLYPTILGSGVNTIDLIGRFVRQRLETCDAWVDALPAQETPDQPVEPEEPVEMVNQVPISTDTDGSIYNGTGYKDNVRLSSSGGVSGTAQNGSVTTGFIPWTNTDVIRIKGAEWLDATTNYTGHFYLNLYNASKAFVTGGVMSSQAYQTDYSTQMSVAYDAATGVTTFQMIDPTGGSGEFRSAAKSAAYFRLNAYGKGVDLIVTVNQEIT